MADDEYERQYMAGDDAVHREKRVSRMAFRLLLGVGIIPLLLTFGSLAAFVFGGDRQGLGGAAIMGTLTFGLAVLAFALPVARTTVTHSDLRFMVGLRLMRVPLRSITETSIGTLDPRTIRNEVAKEGAHVASIYEARGGYVRVRWTDEKGRAQVAWIGSDAPETLLDAIRRATGDIAAVRVDVDDDAVNEAVGEERDADSSRASTRTM